jgi:hypothetical protein
VNGTLLAAGRGERMEPGLLGGAGGVVRDCVIAGPVEVAAGRRLDAGLALPGGEHRLAR